jgi:hypothetical protein
VCENNENSNELANETMRSAFVLLSGRRRSTVRAEGLTCAKITRTQTNLAYQKSMSVTMSLNETRNSKERTSCLSSACAATYISLRPLAT